MVDSTPGNESLSGKQKVVIQGMWATAAVVIAGLGVLVLPQQLASRDAAPRQDMQPYQPQAMPSGYPQPGYPPQQAPGGYPQQAYQGSYQPQPGYQQQPYPSFPGAPSVGASGQAPAPSFPAPQQAQVPAQPSQPAWTQPISRQGVDSGYEIADPAVATQLVNGIASLASVLDVPAGTQATEKNTIIMFFDPRCPYCQSAHKALSGKYPIRFVPVSVLGDATTQLDALPDIRGVLRQQDRVTALHSLMAGQQQGLDVSADAALDAEVKQNLEVWLTLAANLPDRAPAVPLFVVPKASGPLAVIKGWDNSMLPVVDALLKE